MIKVIAFDLKGVLIGEKNIELSSDEDRLERLFGPNISDSEYIEDIFDYVNAKIFKRGPRKYLKKLVK